MASAPESTRPTARDSAALGLQVAIVLLAIQQAILASFGGLSCILWLLQDPELELPATVAYLSSVALHAAISAVLLVCSAPISRFALHWLRDEHDAAACWVTAALVFTGVATAAAALRAAATILVWEATRTDAEVAPVLAELALGLLLVLLAPRIASLWRARGRAAAVPSAAG